MISQYRSAVAALVTLGLVSSYVTPVMAQALPTAQGSPANSEFQPLQPAVSDQALIESSEDEAYALGPGDVIRFDIFNVPEITNGNSTNRLATDNFYNVLVDGTINLPWVGRIAVRGLNLAQATSVIEQRYAEFVIDPVVTLTLVTPRPMRVAVVGEVKRPGAYTTAPAGTPVAAGTTPTELRTVVQAIQAAGGITQLADIRNVEVRRPQMNGPEQVIPVNFFNLLDEGNQAPNLLLRDGDTVFIPTAVALNPEEAQALADANLSPATVGIDVVGEVRAPGRIDIKPNSTLNQAILAAGGFDDPRAQTGQVAFIRLNPDGTVTNRTIDVDLSSGISDENNPSIRENDIVIVSRSGLTRTSDFLELLGGAASAIINPILGITTIINQLTDDDD